MSEWPDPARPGVPMNPERDGQHWVGNVVREWLAEFQMWQDRHGYCVPPATWGVLPYGGPCLTPAEVQAREAAAADEMRGKIQAEEQTLARVIVAADLMEQATALGPDWVATMQLGLDRMGLSDAYACALAAAKREGMEEAAKWHDEQAAFHAGKEEELLDEKRFVTAQRAHETAEAHRSYAAAIRARMEEGA